MKKILSILLAMTMIFAVLAVAASAESKTMNIIWNETDSTQVDVVENYIKPALAEKFPEITFEFTGHGNTDNAIPTLSASGDLPEIWYTGGTDIDPLLAAGDCLDLAPLLGEEWINEHFNNPSAMYDKEGHFYFMAPGQNAYYTPVFYYNTEIFAELGLEEPQSIEELVALCQKLVDAGYIAITSGSWMSNFCLIDGILCSSDSDAYIALCAGEIDWNDERIVKAMSYLDQLLAMKAFTPDLITKDDAGAQAEFQNKEAAMWLSYSWMNDAVTAEGLGFVPGSFNFPASEGKGYVQMTWDPRPGHGGGFTGNVKNEDPALIAEILKVIIDAESTRHNNSGVLTNYKVASPAVPTNPLEIERLEDYNAAGTYQSVMLQCCLDSATTNEFSTLYSMLMADDDSYMSAQFIEDIGPIWENNTYVH